MKIIDQTPFYNENGEISLLDRLKASMQFGKSWWAEMEAQKAVLPVLGKVLDKGYTLLRNISLPGLDTPIPFILVGPSGIYVLYVTPLLGMFRAKGDQWGTISGNTFKPEKTNLLTRTQHLARAVQIFLQRQGNSDISDVEAVLLCANPGVHVDSLRPIVRVVMRDALERFAISILQGRLVLRSDRVYDVVNRISNPPAPKEEAPAAEVGVEIDASTINSRQEAAVNEEYKAPDFLTPDAEPPLDGADHPAFLFGQETLESVPPPDDQPLPKKRSSISRKQWIFLAFMAVVWLILVAIFIFLVVKDLFL
jgi:hypothetical protein